MNSERGTGGTSEWPGVDPMVSRVLRECGRAALSEGGSRRRLGSVDWAGTDWESAVELAHRHRLDLLLFRLLNRQPDGSYPTELYRTLERRMRTTQARNLAMAAELVSVVEALESDGIDVLAYKGPVVASRAYGDISLRRFVDLDLLVAPADYESAVDALRDRGYEQGRTKAQLFETVLTRQNDSFLIDLHSQIVPRYFPFRLPFGELYDRRATVDVGGRAVPALSTVDATIAHSIHGSKHHWFRLEWVLAVAALLRGVDDPVTLFERAGRLGCERMVLLGGVLARRLFGVSFPAGVERRLDDASRSVRVVERAADDIVEWLFTAEWVGRTHDRRTHVADFRLRSRLHSGPRTKFRFWVNALTDPRPEDEEWVELPGPLSPLYRVVRPARLLYEYRRALVDRTSRE